jgi:hypothetical protein
MTILFWIIARFGALIILIVISGCSDPSTDLATGEPQVDRSGFTASVSGIVNGEVSGTGIVTYLPPKERDPVTGVRPGYFLIANLQSDRIEETELTIIFRIPDKAQAGSYDLVPPDPLKVGENFDVQVETVEEGKSILYQTNTAGTITLENFSPDRTDPEIPNITGTFQFVAENSEGGQISATGTFALPLVRQIAFRVPIYS